MSETFATVPVARHIWLGILSHQVFMLLLIPRISWERRKGIYFYKWYHDPSMFSQETRPQFWFFSFSPRHIPNSFPVGSTCRMSIRSPHFSIPFPLLPSGSPNLSWTTPLAFQIIHLPPPTQIGYLYHETVLIFDTLKMIFGQLYKEKYLVIATGPRTIPLKNRLYYYSNKNNMFSVNNLV